MEPSSSPARTRTSVVARVLAPLALIACAVAVIAIVSSTGSDGEDSPREERRAERSEEPKESKEPKEPVEKEYVVEPGDTLIGISEETGVPLPKLERLNPDLDAQTLNSGERIKLR